MASLGQRIGSALLYVGACACAVSASALGSDSPAAQLDLGMSFQPGPPFDQSAYTVVGASASDDRVYHLFVLPQMPPTKTSTDPTPSTVVVLTVAGRIAFLQEISTFASEAGQAVTSLFLDLQHRFGAPSNTYQTAKAVTFAWSRDRFGQPSAGSPATQDCQQIVLAPLPNEISPAYPDIPFASEVVRWPNAPGCSEQILARIQYWPSYPAKVSAMIVSRWDTRLLSELQRATTVQSLKPLPTPAYISP